MLAKSLARWHGDPNAAQLWFRQFFALSDVLFENPKFGPACDEVYVCGKADKAFAPDFYVWAYLPNG